MPLNRKKKRVALINLEEERAYRRASLVDRFLRGVTQFLDALARSPSAVSFRKITSHRDSAPPLSNDASGPWRRNSGEKRGPLSSAVSLAPKLHGPSRFLLPPPRLHFAVV